MSLIKTVMVAAILVSAPIAAQEKVDLDVMNKIRTEGMTNSEVFDILEYLTDNIGPRLSGSPAMSESNKWTAEKMASWGMTNIQEEGIEFGRGWTFEDVSIKMTAPRHSYIQGYPVSWHPGTDGEVEGEVIKVSLRSRADMEAWKGKLAGKIVIFDDKVQIDKPDSDIVRRLDDEELAALEKDMNTPPQLLRWIDGWLFPQVLNEKAVADYLKAEGALAVVKPSPRVGSVIEPSGYSHRIGYTPEIPKVMVPSESYNRILRLMDDGETVRLAVDVDATFYDDDSKIYNTVAEIKGKGRNPEIVMAGAHLDSWFVGDGAVDNGAGVAVVMEAVRILKAIGIEPKRTIRVALWTGEEQGLFGSRAYVQRHFVSYPDKDTVSPVALPVEKQDFDKEPEFKPDFERFSAYFNLDNGSGKIRGVYTEENMEAEAIFDEWLKPFHDLGAETTAPRGTGGTDHLSFQNVGLPGYQFIQDRLDYNTRLHHTQLDVLDNAIEEEMKQAAVIMAAFLYNAAMRDERMPRK